ncbi:MAG: hypothetical protein KatS3mg031_1373 [Chitinophagales bacterium]|nr:MAG: hypothetical protein KatS3mg031_1373 [Chitinophagales bacterium]
MNGIYLFSLIIWLFMVAGCSAPAQRLSFDFEQETVEAIPEGWSEHHYGEGRSRWRIVDDKGNKVLAQLQHDNPRAHFNIVVYDDVLLSDVMMQVRFRAVKGSIDRGGGLLWRYQDSCNHYIVRANPLENNVVLYKMAQCERTDLPLIDKGRTYGLHVRPMHDGWHTLRLIAKGDLFTVFLDGNELFQVKDSTFRAPGKIGLWTKADAVTYFDQLQVEELH